jgi:uncharacterized protein (DUF305 family)
MSALHQSMLFRAFLGAVQVMGLTAVAAGARQISGSEAALSLYAICSTASSSEDPAETRYLLENDKAMKNMMAGMAEAKPTGDVDRDFVSMMKPHHQGAIDMAQAVLRSGRNEQVRRLAQEIIVTQRQEIAAMRMAVAEAPAAGPPLPMQATRTPTFP